MFHRRVLAVSATLLTLLPGKALAASFYPSDGFAEINVSDRVADSVSRHFLETADSIAALPPTYAFSALAHRFVANHWESMPTYLRLWDAGAARQDQTFLTAGHPSLINGFKMGNRQGTSLGSDKAKMFGDKITIEGDTVRFGNKENSLYDGGAQSVIYDWLHFW